MVQINFLFIYFNMHLHRYLFKVLRIILPTWFCCHRTTSGAYSFPNVYIEYHTSVFSMKKFYVFFDCKVTEDSLTI